MGFQIFIYTIIQIEYKSFLYHNQEQYLNLLLILINNINTFIVISHPRQMKIKNANLAMSKDEKTTFFHH